MLSFCAYSRSPPWSEQKAGTVTQPVSTENEWPTCIHFFPPRDEMTSLIVFPPRSPAAQSLWETMLTSKHKEGVMEVRRQLVEAATKEKLPLKMSMGKN